MSRKDPLDGPPPIEREGRRPGVDGATVALVVGLLLVLTPLAITGAAAQTGEASLAGHGGPDCKRDGYNVACNQFGTIRMEGMQDVDGEPVNVSASMVLHTSFEDRDARWVMFSMRNATGGDSPVSIDLTNFSTPSGDVVTTRVIQEEPNELNLWVDVLDLPVDEVITLEATVGVSDRGAFALETVVIPFDRGYEPIKDSDGDTISLFSSTLLAVNEETASIASDEGLLGGNKVGGFEALGAIGAVGFVAGAVRLWRREP